MRFFLTFTLILAFEIIFSQDSCFLHRTPSMDDYVNDTAHLLVKRLTEYVNSFNGCTAPPFVATALNGNKISSEELKGEVVVLNFWFTHCKPCVGEFASLNKLVDEYSGKEVVFISFALDSDNVLDSFLVKHPLKYEIVPSAKGFSELFKVWPYPTNMVLDKNFKVVQGFRGGTVNPDEAMKNYGLIKPFIDLALKK
jgi:cytochrome oxidase Cu insertion factor (SCO1/SenC/PrrC family)